MYIDEINKNENKWGNFLKFLILMGIALYIGTYLSADLHEQVHAVVFDNYNIKYTIHYNLNPLEDYTAYTLVSNMTEYREKCDENCVLANNINEAVGYNINGGITFIFLFIMAVFIYVNFFKK